jgi:hypothetical protein
MVGVSAFQGHNAVSCLRITDRVGGLDFLSNFWTLPPSSGSQRCSATWMLGERDSRHFRANILANGDGNVEALRKQTNLKAARQIYAGNAQNKRLTKGCPLYSVTYCYPGEPPILVGGFANAWRCERG